MILIKGEVILGDCTEWGCDDVYVVSKSFDTDLTPCSVSELVGEKYVIEWLLSHGYIEKVKHYEAYEL